MIIFQYRKLNNRNYFLTYLSPYHLITLLSCIFLFFSSGCVPVTEEMLADMPMISDAIKAPYQGLDPGYKEHETIHFRVQAYASQTASAYASLCEEIYARIMNDIGIYSFSPANPYNIVIYRDAQEFHRKTGQPMWSGGITYGNAILIYESEYTQSVLTHEMCHLIFNEYMGNANKEEFRWINEGIAVYEETRTSELIKQRYEREFDRLVAGNPVPFSQMVNLVPASEKDRIVNKWYVQVRSVVKYMIEFGGNIGFSIFLSKLKSGYSIDKAIEESFVMKWKNLSDLENAWLLHIKR